MKKPSGTSEPEGFFWMKSGDAYSRTFGTLNRLCKLNYRVRDGNMTIDRVSRAVARYRQVD